MFTSGAVNSEKENLIIEMNNIASGAAIYYRTPNQLGGGNRSFNLLTNVSMLGASDSTANGSFVISSVTNTSFVLTATGLTEGVVVQATVTPWGITDGSLQVLNF